MMRWKVLVVLVGLAVLGGLWATASALVATPEPELGEMIRVGTADGAPTGVERPSPTEHAGVPGAVSSSPNAASSEPRPTDAATPPDTTIDGAFPVDPPQSCLAGHDDDDDDCDDDEDKDDEDKDDEDDEDEDDDDDDD